MKRFVISDLHFQHKNILEYSNRPFDSLNHMHEIMINNWNNVVSESDKVYILGDVTMGRSGLKLLSRLNGKKVIIKGNHDIFKLTDYLEYFEDIRGCMKYKDCILTHIPVHPSQKERFKFNIHGHLHEKNINDPFYVNVSVEQVNYTPVDLDKIADV